jgi:hypothetical protein
VLHFVVLSSNSFESFSHASATSFDPSSSAPLSVLRPRALLLSFEKSHSLSPFPATLTDSVSRNSFACRSYKNTGVYVPKSKIQTKPQRSISQRSNLLTSLESDPCTARERTPMQSNPGTDWRGAGHSSDLQSALPISNPQSPTPNLFRPSNLSVAPSHPTAGESIPAPMRQPS